MASLAESLVNRAIRISQAEAAAACQAAPVAIRCLDARCLDARESSDANPASRSMTSEQPVKLVLARPSGTVIHRFEEVPYDSVEDFVQRMEEGYIIGVPRCAVSEEGQRARPASCEMTVQCHAGACFDAPVVLRREGSARTQPTDGR